jgi:hypothetical protein
MVASSVTGASSISINSAYCSSLKLNISLDRGRGIKVDRGTPVRVDRGIGFDRGISDADPAGEPCQAIHASKANLSIECHFDTY